MNSGNLIIQFNQDNGFLCPESPLTLANLGLADSIKEFKDKAYWELRVIDFDSENGKLFADVSSYKIGIPEIPKAQQSNIEKLKKIKSISFRQIDTGGLLKTAVIKFTGNTEKKHRQLIEETKPQPPVIEKPKPIEEQPVITEPVTIYRSFQGEFYIPIKELKFVMGGVSCTKLIKGIESPLEFFIANYEIREEFDAVKNYFANFLQTKKITVRYSIKTINGEIDSIQAKSLDIDKINKESIESVKFEFVQKSFTKRINGIEDKSLFTLEEAFDALSNREVKSNAFYQDAGDLLNDLLKITNTKHYKNLRYLSSLHAYSIMKLRFVLKPLSFVFLIAGDRYYYLVWETLDTAEATYIWRSERNKEALKASLYKVEDILNIIKVQGKIAYINTGDEALKRIYHDYSDLKEGFIKWKGELDSCLR